MAAQQEGLQVHQKYFAARELAMVGQRIPIILGIKLFLTEILDLSYHSPIHMDFPDENSIDCRLDAMGKSAGIHGNFVKWKSTVTQMRGPGVKVCGRKGASPHRHQPTVQDRLPLGVATGL